jgi:hypothetical protein
MIEAAEHNLMQYFHSVGLLRLFCACLFEYWHEDVRPDLLALVVRAARLSWSSARGWSHGAELRAQDGSCQHIVAADKAAAEPGG